MAWDFGMGMQYKYDMGAQDVPRPAFVALFRKVTIVAAAVVVVLCVVCVCCVYVSGCVRVCACVYVCVRVCVLWSEYVYVHECVC